MLRSEAITIIKRGLGFRQTQDAAIIAALKQAQRDLELGRTLPDWLLVYDAPITVVGNVATAALPERFLRFHEEYQMYYLNSDGKPVGLPVRRPEEAYDAYGTQEHAPPVYPSVVVLRGDGMVTFVPVPTVSFTARLTYYRGAEVLDSELENAWLKRAANYLIGLAGTMVAGDLRDAGAQQKFASMAQIGQRGYIGDVVETELAGRPLIMGRNN